MANEKEKLQQATDSLTRIKADAKIRLDTLQARLDAASYKGQRAEIQRDIDQLTAVFDQAIDRAEINRTKLEAEYLVQKKEQEASQADQRAAQEEQIKSDALREWTQAGGDPARFASAWPLIKETVLNERVINALLNHNKPDVAIKF